MKVPKLPKAVEKLIGTGKPGCPVCGGVGVRVLACLTGAAYRPCVCTERTRCFIVRCTAAVVAASLIFAAAVALICQCLEAR